MSERLAMFPLGTPLVPGALLPLQIFEPRYQQMMLDVLASPAQEFGIALIERGHEVGGGELRSMIGTAARILDSKMLDDGRRMIVVVGVGRIRVHEWLVDDPYPQALVEEWPDGPCTEWSAENVARLFDDLREASSLVEQLGGLIPDFSEVELSSEASMASFQLTALAPIGSADRQRLLSSPDPVDRLRLLSLALEDVKAACQFRLQE